MCSQHDRRVIALVLCVGTSVSLAADGQQAAETLKEKGLKRVLSTFVLPEEVDVQAKLRDTRGLEKPLDAAIAAKKSLAKKQRSMEDELSLLTARRRQLNAQLPQLIGNVEQYNQGIATLNQINGRIQELLELKYRSEEAKEVEKQFASAREKYTDFLLEIRAQADEVLAKYATLAKDEGVVGAVGAMSEADGKRYALGPSKTFQSAMRQLERLEKAVQRDEIQLRRESDTFWVQVALNGKPTRELVFDTGASAISLPASMAAEVGLKPSASDPDVQVSIADGSIVVAKEMLLESVKVGRFEVGNVRCIVMPASLANAPPLLGGSFLNQFSYRIDTDSGKLTLTRIDEGSDSGPASKSKSTSRSTSN